MKYIGKRTKSLNFGEGHKDKVGSYNSKRLLNWINKRDIVCEYIKNHSLLETQDYFHLEVSTIKKMINSKTKSNFYSKPKKLLRPHLKEIEVARQKSLSASMK